MTLWIQSSYNEQIVKLSSFWKICQDIDYTLICSIKRGIQQMRLWSFKETKQLNDYVKTWKVVSKHERIIRKREHACIRYRFRFYESDNSHFAIAISVGECDPLTSISVYLRMKLEQGNIRSHMNNWFKMSYFNILKIAPDSSLFKRFKV